MKGSLATLRGVIGALALSLLCGCVTTRMYTGSPRPQEVATLVGGQGKHGIILDSFDGREFFTFSFFYGAKIEFLPGEHTLVCHWNYAGMRSRGNYMVRFQAEAGRTYALNFPANFTSQTGSITVTDETTGEVVSYSGSKPGKAANNH